MEFSDLQKKNCYYLVVCALFQNEEFFIKEWLDHHLSIGVEHFYLYDNNSSDKSREILQPYIEEGLVDIFEWDIETKTQQDYLSLLQIPVYEHALTLVLEGTKWAAFIDLDEFLIPRKHFSMIPLLRSYEAYGALAVNWQVFGTSGIDELPSGMSILQHFTWKAEPQRPLNKFVKLIVQPSLVEKISSPHHFQFKEGYGAISEDLTPVHHGTTEKVHRNIIQINHYWFGSKQWFLTKKVPRRELWGIPLSGQDMESLIDSFNQVEDRSACVFVPEVSNGFKDPPEPIPGESNRWILQCISD